MSSFEQRLDEFIQLRGLKKAEIARTIAVSSSALSKLISGKSNPSDQTIRLLALSYGLHEQWLRDGTGQMLMDSAEESSRRALGPFYGDNLFMPEVKAELVNQELETLRTKVEEQEKTIVNLNRLIGHLEEEIRDQVPEN